MKKSRSKPPRPPVEPQPSFEAVQVLADAVEQLEAFDDEVADFADRDLLDAAAHGDAAGVRDALLLAPSPNAVRGETGESALLLAIARGSTDAVRALLDAGADPEMACDVARAGVTLAIRPLALAQFLERAAIAELLRGAGARDQAPRGGKREGAAAPRGPGAHLALAIVFGDVALVRAALAAGASAGATEPDRGTPMLLLAIRAGHADVVESLLDAGASANSEEAFGGARRSALDVARQEERFEIVRLLRARGGRPSRTPLRRQPPAGAPRPDPKLAAAVANRDHRSVQARLAAGADANGVDGTGVPYLLTAVRARDVALVNLLLENEAYPDVEHAGVSALQVAVAQGDIAMVEALLDENADPDRPMIGEALIALEPSVQTAILRRLLCDGLDPDTKAHGEPLLFHTARERRLAALELLLGHGADVNAVGANGVRLDVIVADDDVLARLTDHGLGRRPRGA